MLLHLVNLLCLVFRPPIWIRFQHIFFIFDIIFIYTSKKWCWTHPPLPTSLTLFGYFHTMSYQVLKCALIGYHCKKKFHTKWAKPVDETNTDCFVVFVISSQTYWSKVKILQNLKQKKLFFIKKGIYIVYLKKQKISICHRTTFYVVFNMGSFRKVKIQNDLPKITQNQVNLLFV